MKLIMQTTSIGWIVKKGKNMSNSGAKFKVGDKVKIINASGGGVLGEIKLTVKSVHDHTAFSCGWFYNFIEGSGLYENRLELVQEEFKEGRIYQPTGINKIYTCTYVSPLTGAAMMERENPNESITVWIPSVYWKEVKEKVKATRYVHWFWNSDGSDFYTDTNGDPEPNLKYYNKKRDYIKTDTVECEAEVR